MVRHLYRAVTCVCLLLVASPCLLAQELRLTPAVALERLKDGNARFAADTQAAKDIGNKRRTELARGQHPFAVILSCADSRIVPEWLFDQGLGDLFVLRIAGNVAEQGMLASTEYAVEHFHVPLIVVLGHDRCGAVQAAVDGKPLPGHLGWLVKQVFTGDNLPAGKPEAVAAAIRANAIHQAEALTRKSPELKELMDHKRVQVVAGVYSLATGKISWSDVPEPKRP
ncbi:MAG TPA: carbonic anhydrase [Gemmataceae bacterium]|nr:carbonic anhydrase [Gemmataceae bacterium]